MEAAGAHDKDDEAQPVATVRLVFLATTYFNTIRNLGLVKPCANIYKHLIHI